VTRTATLLVVSRMIFSKVMSSYTKHGKTTSAKRNSGWKWTPTERERRILTKWKRVSDMIRWVVLQAVTYFRKRLHFENTQGSLQSGMPGPRRKHGGGSLKVWAVISWYSFMLAPLLPFMAELLQGSTCTGWVIWCIQ
jgi:hypothetical protein